MANIFQKSNRNTILTGRNIYKGKRDQILYFNKKENIVYRISPDKENLFSTYQSRYVLALISFILFYVLFNIPIVVSTGLSLAIALFMEIRYRSFLKKCPQSKGFLKNENATPIEEAIELNTANLILRIVLYSALAILLIINALTSDNVVGNVPLQVASYVIAIFAGFFIIKYISLFVRKRSGS